MRVEEVRVGGRNLPIGREATNMDRDEALRLLRGGQKGVNEWNWRRNVGESVPDLSEVNLGEADLSRADLSRTGLSGANLIFANLGGANLFWSVLSGADLREADLSGSNL